MKINLYIDYSLEKEIIKENRFFIVKVCKIVDDKSYYGEVGFIGNESDVYRINEFGFTYVSHHECKSKEEYYIAKNKSRNEN